MRVVVLSGGLDSCVAASLAAESGATRAISIDYGQRHRKELIAARAVADRLGIEHRLIDATGLLSGSALLGEHDIPTGRYDDASMTATVVHGRNLLLASIAIASTRRGDTIWVGVHAGDHPIYADCRPAFWHALTELAMEAYTVGVYAPFLEWSKAQIVKAGRDVGAPMALSWSCYEGKGIHCGKCGTCVERAEAFAVAGVDDPTEYADATFWREATARAPH
jgi:7-cyano-7-deazaguanine synthase